MLHSKMEKIQHCQIPPEGAKSPIILDYFLFLKMSELSLSALQVHLAAMRAFHHWWIAFHLPPSYYSVVSKWICESLSFDTET